MKIIVLGSGGSGGVPLINGYWGKCNPHNPKNRRRRVSILIQIQEKNILIDTSPDLRNQILEAGITKIDAILYTHDHADHTHGIDDLRFLERPKGKKFFPCFGTKQTIESLQRRFPYAFGLKNNDNIPQESLYEPLLKTTVIQDHFSIDDIHIQAFQQGHGPNFQSTGFRVNNFAYSTDTNFLTGEIIQSLKGLDLWIVDCLRWEPHITHAHVDLALSWIDRVKPKQALLTHLSSQVDYDELLKYCPSYVQPAYDGLIINL